MDDTPLIPEDFTALVSPGTGLENCEVKACSPDMLAESGIALRLEFSSLNYKDALSARGHKGISPRYPHIPGIDAAGVRLDTGEKVLVTGFDFGMGTSGGLSQYARVDEGWLIPLPETLSPGAAMAYGTAGITAALCVDALLANGTTPASGPVLVSGATGGVGSISCAILGRLGFEVHALSGKADASMLLEPLGVSRVLSRTAYLEAKDRALFAPDYAAAIDTLGGEVLSRMLRSIQFGGIAAACGMAADTELAVNVYPFILRGVRLAGIASADTPVEKKKEMWERLAGPWRCPLIEEQCREVDLAGSIPEMQAMLEGGARGRVRVRCL